MRSHPQAIPLHNQVSNEVNIMSRRYNQNQSPLVRIVYSKVVVNGKVELVPLELYADGSLKRAA
ncbi:hypothetical protein H6G23_18190 [Desertifilum sp. FACHB-866]|uniref:Uncharacterized protein n=1 Tax=Desertifilum tharense IPPAS B-1220 TaxID=1781255 RepID=A0ACD5H6G8_9CYAN|nr:hypothetical protein [Desertifilum tharense]MBD2323622.1 hypothetical protein [Desertifilum sp. FACHB-866]MBD2332319.1 hypothetical protein [Desertifilum sp. FACHB-868]MCD8486938.1 hypothetical protein [Desertifilum sp.]